MTQDVVSSTADVSASQFMATGIDPMATAIRLTQELFPGQVRVEVEQDPEIPNDSYVVFNVAAEGTIPDIIKRRLEWHSRVRELIPERAQRLRLSVEARA